MKRVIIADITSLKKNGKIFGHFKKVNEMYINLLKREFDVEIAGGPIYFKDGIHGVKLRYDNDIDNMIGKYKKIIVKYKEIYNCIYLLNNNNNATIIFQSYSLKSILISILLTNTNNKIYLIQYKDELKNLVNKILYQLTKNKIAGIICSNQFIGESYDNKFIVMPDYIYNKKSIDTNTYSQIYDFGMFGIISDGKDVEDVINRFRNTNYKVIIAGYFNDEERYDKIMNDKTDNILVINKYLDEHEYNAYIGKTKYVLLPYSEYYKSASSGVIYDVLFNKKPVITKNYDNFKFVKNYNIGVLYDKKLNEVDIDYLLSDVNYNNMVDNIDIFINDNLKQGKELVNFLKE